MRSRGCLVAACLILTACKPGEPQAECERSLREARDQLVKVERRLTRKLEQRRPGGATEWLQAVDALTLAQNAQAESDFQTCLGEVEHAKRYLAQASRRY